MLKGTYTGERYDDFRTDPGASFAVAPGRFFGLIFALQKFLDFLKEFRGEYKIIERLAFASEYCLVITGPVAMTLVDEYDVLANSEHGVHIVGIDYRRDAILMRDVAQKLVYHDRCAGVKTGVGLVAE